MVVAPNLLVDVLLGIDAYPMERVEVDRSLAVWARLKQRQMERELAEAPEGPTAHSNVDVLPTHPADPQPESKGGGGQSQGPEVEDDEVGEDSEDPLPVGEGTGSHMTTEDETGGDEDAAIKEPLQANLSQFWQWQQEDPSLAKVLEVAQDNRWRGQAVESICFTEMDFCIDIGNLRGPSHGTCKVLNSWSCPELAVGWFCALAMMSPWLAT